MIAQTGAVLASSVHGLMWIQQNGKELSTLTAVTNDGRFAYVTNFGDGTISAPHIRSSWRRSSDVFSGITQTRR